MHTCIIMCKSLHACMSCACLVSQPTCCCCSTRPCADAFNSVRQQRYERFQAAFDHVAKQIDPIYKVRFRADLQSGLLAVQAKGVRYHNSMQQQQQRRQQPDDAFALLPGWGLCSCGIKSASAQLAQQSALAQVRLEMPAAACCYPFLFPSLPPHWHHLPCATPHSMLPTLPTKEAHFSS